MAFDADVIVAGAGPAGAVAAATLAGRGVDTLLVDRAAFPRNKPCGGGLSARALRRFPWLTPAVGGIDVHQIRRLHLEGPRGSRLEIEDAETCVVLIRRIEFDAALVSRAADAGARLDTAFEITQASQDEEGVTLQSRDGRRLRARMVVAADGVHSVIAKRLGVNARWPRTHLAIDMMEETPVETLAADRPDVLWVAYAHDGLDGYAYIFPKVRHVNVGIGCVLAHFDAHVADAPYALQQRFVASLVDRGVLRGRSDRSCFTPFLIPVGGPLRRTTHGRVLFTGDAGGFVHAITAEGIYYALVTGELAGQAIAGAGGGANAREAGARYEAAWRREIGAELADAVRVQKYLFSSHERVARVVNGASGSATLTSLILDYFKGHTSYGTLRRRMILRFPMTILRLARVAVLVLLCLLGAFGASAGAQTAPPPIAYRVSIPEPEHHWLEVEATFRDLGTSPLRARMSRSSPGRYAVHEFSKNVFAFSAYDSTGRRLAATRPDADEWRVDGHDGTVRVVYRVFGDYADGTYMAVDTTHAHLNVPATFMWAAGLESRPIEIRFTPPADSGWTVGTQLFPTADRFTFTAPNLQYFMDSPSELARLVESTFTVNDDGRETRFRLLAHTSASQADLDALAALVRRVVVEARRVFGVFPVFEPGHYTFLLDYVPWAEDDAMEHRNSTYISSPAISIASEAGRLAALDAIAHEFFHVWNVERIRPAGLEPFDFTRENVTCCLWLAEGFTEYYGPLVLKRAGLRPSIPLAPVVTAMTHPARLVRSAVEMSEHAPFADASVANDVDDRSRTFISYYTHGAAIALALDLSVREATSGRLSLDDYMRRLWTVHGAAAPPRPGEVARPYSLADLRRELGALMNDAAFADAFFDRYVEGRDVPGYARLLALAGFAVRPASASRGWLGSFRVLEEAGGLLVGMGWAGGVVPFGTPAYEAGLDRGDLIAAIDGRPATIAAWNDIGRRRPGDRVALTVRRRDGREVSLTVTLAADPSVTIGTAASAGPAGEAARAFRAAWLGE